MIRVSLAALLDCFFILQKLFLETSLYTSQTQHIASYFLFLISKAKPIAFVGFFFPKIAIALFFLSPIFSFSNIWLIPFEIMIYIYSILLYTRAGSKKIYNSFFDVWLIQWTFWIKKKCLTMKYGVCGCRFV